jgi:Flp pilus assembly protein TadD
MLSDPEASSSPETLKTWSKLAVGQANLFADRNYTAEAEQTYRLSMEMWPRNIESVGNLSDLLVRTGRAEEARRLVEDFVRSHPDLSSALESFHPGIVAKTQPTPSRP